MQTTCSRQEQLLRDRNHFHCRGYISDEIYPHSVETRRIVLALECTTPNKHYYYSCHCLFALWQTFFADPFVQEHVRLDAVVCLCDSPRLMRTLLAPTPPPPPPLARALAPVAASTTDGAGAEGGSEALAEEEDEQKSGSSAAGPAAEAAAAAATLVMSQLALSDRVLLNKSDLITADEVST